MQNTAQEYTHIRTHKPQPETEYPAQRAQGGVAVETCETSTHENIAVAAEKREGSATTREGGSRRPSIPCAKGARKHGIGRERHWVIALDMKGTGAWH